MHAWGCSLDWSWGWPQPYHMDMHMDMDMWGTCGVTAWMTTPGVYISREQKETCTVALSAGEACNYDPHAKQLLVTMKNPNPNPSPSPNPNPNRSPSPSPSSNFSPSPCPSFRPDPSQACRSLSCESGSHCYCALFGASTFTGTVGPRPRLPPQARSRRQRASLPNPNPNPDPDH